MSTTGRDAPDQPDGLVIEIPLHPLSSATLTVLALVAVIGGCIFLAGWVRARRAPAGPGIDRVSVLAGLVGLGAALFWLVLPYVAA